MIRTWLTWLAFVLCFAVVLTAMAWISMIVLQLEQHQQDARQAALTEENVRLALWRMDSALAPLIAQENARQSFAFAPFYQAQGALARPALQLSQADQAAQVEYSPVMVPSPLLLYRSSHIRLHFQVGLDGTITSPQAPTGEMRTLALAYLSEPEIEQSRRRLEQLQAIVDLPALRTQLAQLEPPQAPPQFTPEQQAQQQITLPEAARSQQAWMQRRMANQLQNQLAHTLATPILAGSELIRPVWINQHLLLARVVSIQGQEYLQGCWLNWPVIRWWLLESIRDLLPRADLEPVDPATLGQQTRMLASLPLRLNPGRMRAVSQPASPIRISLYIAWGCVLVAGLAVAFLVYGAIALGQRRGAFVSAVTHELRTPLTTFRMYTEMLATGMVRDPDKIQRYLNTLEVEAQRLSHLVENVLAYARLERSRPSRAPELITLGQLLSRITPRLQQRCQQAGMQLEITADPDLPDLTLHTDVAAVEQVLFNLVDNACKYASRSEQKLIEIQCQRNGRKIELQVRDHGPGVAPAMRRRLFKPFCKPTQTRSDAAQGVGLGLALCERYARQVGGRLKLESSDRGACFILQLPLTRR